jgi:putative ABC transport system substrate-binding protein
MRRREFIGLLGGAAAWPHAARAQQSPLPTIGFLSSQSAEGFVEPLRGFRQGLKDTGFADGDNVTVDYRWAENQPARLPALAAELVRRRVAVIVALGSAAALEAKRATTRTSIIFVVGNDPVRLGLVAGIARPGGNVTGIHFFTAELVAKRLELLRELVPETERVAVLVNPAEPISEPALRDVQAAARSMGLQVQIFKATTAGEINAAFADLARERPQSLFVGPGPFFASRRVQFAQLAARHAIPAIYAQSGFVQVGGLISYGANNTEAWRQAALYIGSVLKGTKPADLPVVQLNKFELVINAETARMLGLSLPPSLIARADEVIE